MEWNRTIWFSCAFRFGVLRTAYLDRSDTLLFIAYYGFSFIFFFVYRLHRDVVAIRLLRACCRILCFTNNLHLHELNVPEFTNMLEAALELSSRKRSELILHSEHRRKKKFACFLAFDRLRVSAHKRRWSSHTKMMLHEQSMCMSQTHRPQFSTCSISPSKKGKRDPFLGVSVESKDVKMSKTKAKCDAKDWNRNEKNYVSQIASKRKYIKMENAQIIWIFISCR